MNVENQFRTEFGKKTNQIMLVIFIVSMVFIAMVALTGERVFLEPSPLDFRWNEGWYREDGTTLSLPYTDKQNDSLTIRKTLPEDLTRQDSMVFSTSYLPVQVTVDGKKLPVVGTFEGKFDFAAAYSHVALSPEMSGKEVIVTFRNLGTKQWMEMYSIKLGNFNLIRQAAFAKNSVPVISSTILLAVSMLIFIIGLAQNKSAIQVLNNHTQMFLLGSMLATMFSIWTLVDTETVALLFGGNPAYVFVNLFSYLFIIGPWLMQVILMNQKTSFLLRLLAMAGLIETAIVMILAGFGIFKFSLYMTASHLICAVVEGVVIYLTIDGYRKRKDFSSFLILAASILILVMSIITTIAYYFAASPNNISFLQYGIFGYILVMIYDLFATFKHINLRYVSEMEAARKAAEDANRAKSEFLSSMSHDIRTPMNAIMGLTTIASAHIDNKEIVKDALHKITLSSRHLLGLINDILDMSKIESGKISLTIEALSLSELMENLLNIIQPQIKSRRQKFDIFIENISSENVYCDGVRLNQVLLNLLSNAVKFTREEGCIYVTLHQENSPKGERWVRTSFRVTDTGIGMAPEFIGKIFDSFARADTRHVQTTEGTGLGMSITKHIVEMMEGSITVDSSLGKGTTFTVTLDLERVAPKEESRVLPSWNTLVVDDDKQLCLSAVDTLHDMGIKADWTLSGKEAVELVDQCAHGLKPYHLVLLDWQMPDMDGIETARRIRERVGEDVPILLITAYDWSEIEQEAREAGINGFLAKPLFESTLRYGLLHYVGENDEIVDQAQEEAWDFTGRRILVAEDNDINWEIDEEILSSHGFLVERAEDGEACLRMFEASAPGYYDIILMDIRMPRMDGYECTAAIRALQREDAAAMPILAMTADAFQEDIKHSLEVGMDGHIAKPLDFKTLLRLIKINIEPQTAAVDNKADATRGDKI